MPEQTMIRKWTLDQFVVENTAEALAKFNRHYDLFLQELNIGLKPFNLDYAMSYMIGRFTAIGYPLKAWEKQAVRGD